jgi:hypothetical protein
MEGFPRPEGASRKKAAKGPVRRRSAVVCRGVRRVKWWAWVGDRRRRADRRPSVRVHSVFVVDCEHAIRMDRERLGSRSPPCPFARSHAASRSRVPRCRPQRGSYFCIVTGIG